MSALRLRGPRWWWLSWMLLPGLAGAQEIRSKTFESVSPNGKVSIVSRCDGQRHTCDVSAQSGTTVIEIGPRGYRAGPGIRWVNLDTAAIEFKCGDGCQETWFYNPRLGKSIAYRDVLAVDGVRMRLAVADPARRDIEVHPIRAETGAAPTCRIVRDWPSEGGFALGGVLVHAVFRSDGNLRLQYQRGADATTVTDEVVIDKAGAC